MTSDVLGPCRGCRRPMANRRRERQPDQVSHAGHGYCDACYMRLRRSVGVDSRQPVRDTWAAKRSCQGADVDPAVFTADPVNNRPVPAVVVEAARRWCAGCPVRQQCGQAADERREIGLWSGIYRIQRTNRKRDYVKYDLLAPKEEAAA